MSEGTQGLLSQRLLLGLVVLLTLATFGPSLANGFVWDDIFLLVNNAQLRGDASLWTILTTGLFDVGDVGQPIELMNPKYLLIFRPVIKFAYWVQYQAFGMEALGFHAVSVLLHATNTGLVFLLLQRRLGEPSPQRTWASALGAALFALHPSRAESVSWISGSTDLWMTTLGLAAYWFAARGGQRALIAALCMSAAILAKEPIAILPALFWADERLGTNALDEGQLRKGLLALFAGAALGLFAVACLAVPRWLAVEMPASGITPRGRIAVLGSISSLLVEPDLVLQRPTFDPNTGDFAELDYVLGAMLLLIIALAGFAALRNKKLKGTLLAGLASDALWLGLPLLIPAFTAWEIKSARLIYFPVLGLSALIARLLHALFKQASASHTRPIAFSAGAVTLLLCGVLLASQRASARFSASFHDAVSLWSVQMQVQPENVGIHNFLSAELLEQKRYEEARAVVLEGLVLAHAQSQPDAAANFLVLLFHLDTSATPAWAHDEIRTLNDRLDPLLRGQGLAYESKDKRYDVPIVLEPGDARRKLGVILGMGRIRANQISEGVALLDQLPVTLNTLVWQLRAAAYARDWDGVRKFSAALENQPTLEGELNAIHRAMQMAEDAAQSPEPDRLLEAKLELLLNRPHLAREILEGLGADVPLLESTTLRVESFVMEDRVAEAELALGDARSHGLSEQDYRAMLDKLGGLRDRAER